MNHKGYHHLTWADRLTIEKMLKAGCSKPQIAKALGVCRTTIYYELKRGSCTQITSDYEYVDVYSPEIAERKYRENLSAKGGELKIGHDKAFAAYLEEKIVDEHYSPGAALAAAEEENCFSTKICISTLYNYIYGGEVFLRLKPMHLHEKGRRRYLEKTVQAAARAPQGESIERRSPEILKRNTFGHWEMDSVLGVQGSKRALVVLTERKTRMGVIMPVPDHTAQSVVNALNRLEKEAGDKFYRIFKSITVDNGCEFADNDGIEFAYHHRRKKRTKLYYCHPYSPHERGSNENMNRIIRRFFPKGTNFDKVQLCDIKAAEDWMNDYPRRLLGWKSARFRFNEELRQIGIFSTSDLSAASA